MHWNLKYTFALISLKADQEHLLMIYNQVVDTVVMLVYWNRRLSCGLCFHARPDSSLKIILPFDTSLQMDFLLDPIFNFSIFSSSCEIGS